MVLHCPLHVSDFLVGRDNMSVDVEDEEVARGERAGMALETLEEHSQGQLVLLSVHVDVGQIDEADETVSVDLPSQETHEVECLHGVLQGLVWQSPLVAVQTQSHQGVGGMPIITPP